MVAWALIMAAIVLGGNPIMFVDPASAAIVIGGTVGVTLVKNPLASVLGTVKILTKAFSVKLSEPDKLITEITELARKARKEGMALETVVISYEFLGKGVSLCVDGVEAAEIRGILETDVGATAQRPKRGAEILDGMGQAAPAFGMIGTLIGLVQMLATLDDPSSIGPAMAVALLTTLYGALPMAEKLRARSREELMSMSICIEGVLGLSQGDNPNSIDQKLKSFLAPNMRAGAKAKEAETPSDGDSQEEQAA